MITRLTSLPGVTLVEPRMFSDTRGFFYESWNAQAFEDAGLPTIFVQDNHSRSARNVLRGLHYQVEQPQGKLVRVTRGAAFDVVLDIVADSPTFGCWESFVLTEDDGQMLWIPPGYAHGFLSLSDQTDFLYKCTTAYMPALERSIVWDDPLLAIDWPLDGCYPLLSTKDAAAPPLSHVQAAA